MRNIIVTLLILLCTTVNAQQAGIQEINSSSFAVSDKITYHIIFPTDIKYFSIGDDNVAGEKIAVFPRAIRLKAAGKPFKKTTNMSVVTADGKYYSYNISYSEYLNETYRAIEGNYASPYNIEVNDKQHIQFLQEE